MKQIVKSMEPESFTAWRMANPNATYKDLGKNAPTVKNDLKNALIEDQHYLCCYCECRISSSSSHIEHFKPKGQPWYGYQLDYSNLFASCTPMPLNTPEEHCGHRKSNIYSQDLICPSEPHCESHFSYLLNGEISFTDHRGEISINVLNLKSAVLTARRKILIDTLLDEYDIDEAVSDHLNTTKRMYGEFFSMVEYLHNQGQL